MVDFTGDYYDEILEHHGVLGQKWGVRRYQYEDGSLTPAGKKRLEKLDSKWADKNADKITKAAEKSVSSELRAYTNQLLKNQNAYKSNGKLSAATVNAYNRRMAELMSESVSGLTSPSGRTVTFVAKRGNIGVYMALADQGYDMSKLKNGVWDSGKVAYKKTVLDKM